MKLHIIGCLCLFGMLLVGCGSGQFGDNNHPSKLDRTEILKNNALTNQALVWDEKNWDDASWAE